jgi:hypothetical protein
MEVEELTAVPVLGNRGHQRDLVTDLRFVSKPRQVMRGVFEQEGNTVTAANCGGAWTRKTHDFTGSG